MSVHYSRPGHSEILEDAPAAAPPLVGEASPIYVKIHELIAEARAAGATDEDLHVGLTVAKDTVKAILRERTEAAIAATAA